MTMVNEIMRFWYRNRRNRDLEVLWPLCCARAGMDINKAKSAFAFYVFHDKAWSYLTEHEIKFILGRLILTSRERICDE